MAIYNNRSILNILIMLQFKFNIIIIIVFVFVNCRTTDFFIKDCISLANIFHS
jgi:hypothetical protein